MEFIIYKKIRLASQYLSITILLGCCISAFSSEKEILKSLFPQTVRDSLKISQNTENQILYTPIETPKNNIPYEICRDDKKGQMTKEIINFNSENTTKSEEGYCFECDNNSDTNYEMLEEISGAVIQKTSHIPKSCFLLSQLKAVNTLPKPSSYYYCGKLKKGDNLLDKKPVLITKEDRLNDPSLAKHKHRIPCLSKIYVDMTSKAFNKMANCFQFNQSEKEHIFQLKNHESGFILNAKSNTAARCYGQLTMDAINHVLINVKNKQKIYKDFKSKCPNLKYPIHFKRTLILSNESVEDWPELSKRDNEKKKYLSSRHITCQVTQDPYSCLFYSLFYFKMNLDEAKKRIETPYQKITKDTFKNNPGLARFFSENPQVSYPVKANEVIVVEGTGTSIKTGNKLNIQWIFSNSVSAYRDISKLKDKQLSIRTVKLFDSDKLAIKMAQWSHNGGGSIAKSYFPTQLRDFKSLVVNPPKPSSYKSNAHYCYKNPKKRFCKYRKTLFTSTKPIKFSRFSKFLSKHLRQNYKVDDDWTEQEKKDRRNEVADFLDKIENDFLSMKDKNAVKQRLENLNKNRNYLFKGDFDQFTENLDNHCGLNDTIH